MKKTWIIITAVICVIAMLTACGGKTKTDGPAGSGAVNTSENGMQDTAGAYQQITQDEAQQIMSETVDMRMFINGEQVPVMWDSNPSVNALRQLASGEGLTVQMSKYGGFEQVGELGTDLERNDIQMTTEPGDIVLYSGNQIVVFYGNNSWAYTKLGKINLSEEQLTELLGKEDVEITLQY